jgi:hypothetical protein
MIAGGWLPADAPPEERCLGFLFDLLTNDDACHLAALLDEEDKIRNRAAIPSRRAKSLLTTFSGQITC